MQSDTASSQDASDSDDGAPRPFDVELFIVHPTLEPAEISAALGLDRASTSSGYRWSRRQRRMRYTDNAETASQRQPPFSRRWE